MLRDSCQLVLQHVRQEQVAGSQVQTVGRGEGVHRLNLLLVGQKVPEDAGGLDGGVVPAEDEPGLHFQFHLLYPLQKHFEGADSVDGVLLGTILADI